MALCLALAIVTLLLKSVQAQGGPPMITDDPGTPGNGHVEANIAATIEASGHEQSWELPAIDLNYGLGERIQLTFETGAAVVKREDHGPIGGWGGSAAAVKWRFLDEKENGLSMSVFPRVEWNMLPSSVRRGLVEDGTRVFLPVEMARGLGMVDLDIEVGSLVSSVGRSELVYGIVAGVPLSSVTSAMVELHGNARTNMSLDRLTVNAGFRQKLTGSSFLIVSMGHEVRSPPGEPLSLIGYFGVQLVF